MHDETLDALYYCDPSVYRAERKSVFAHNWLFFGLERDVAEPGSCFAATIAGYPLLLVRGEDRELRAFHNLCRHRAGPLAEEGASRCGTSLVCRYHGWRYALDGRLASARDFGAAQGFDPRQYGLMPLAVAVWRGLVFVNLDCDAPPFENVVAPLERRLGDRGFERFTRAERSQHDLKCNWKTYVENYLEGYHIPVLHPSLNASLGSAYGVEVEGNLQFYYADAKEGAAVAGLWGWMWPCLGFNVYADGILIERMLPVDADNTRLEYLFLFAPEADEDAVGRAVSASLVTTAEDIAMCEAVQRNLSAGIYRTGRLSPKHEHGVQWFQDRIRDALAVKAS